MDLVQEEVEALGAYSRIVISVVEKVAPSVANLRVRGGPHHQSLVPRL
jgi:hypothetical protein